MPPYCQTGQLLSTNTTASAIVPEILRRSNYDRWSICMESYLISEDLWDGIIVPYSADHLPLSESEFRRKNAACLHAIQISCIPEKFDQIKEIRSAKEAWDKLAQLNAKFHGDQSTVAEIQTLDRASTLLLLNAIHKGDVDAVRDFYTTNPRCKNAIPEGCCYTILQSATLAVRLNIVEALVEIMSEEIETAYNARGTALALAAVYGMTEIAECLVRHNEKLLTIPDADGCIPLAVACSADIMFDVLDRCPSIINGYRKYLFDGFTGAPAAFLNGNGLTFWQQWIYDRFKVNITSVSTSGERVAISQQEGNFEKKLAITQDDTRGSILMAAIAHRQEKIACFINGLPIAKTLIRPTNKKENNVLHIAGKLAPDYRLASISGAALQMQREAQWFKEVENIVTEYDRDSKNIYGDTPYQVFTREHKDLLGKAEIWMKETASSYTVVGALIITIMFTAAFTSSEGYNQDTGYPMFKDEAAFAIYIISDAISLFAASASVLMFLGILTSRYKIEDFRKSLPQRLIIGLFTLFISIAAMMITFCSTLFLLLHGRWQVIIPTMVLAGIPVTLFVWLQFPFLLEIWHLTYRSPIFEEKRSLASKNNACFTRKKKKIPQA